MTLLVNVSDEPPYSTTTYVMLLIFGAIAVVILAMVLSNVVSYTAQVNNNMTMLLANTSNQLGYPQKVVGVEAQNSTILYLNSSYSKAEYVDASMLAFISALFTNPVSITIIVGITLVVYALFELKRTK